MNRTYNILTIAGSDNSGGAGIQADIKTISALGCFATVAITAVCSENTMRVQGVYPVTPEQLDEQIVLTCEDIAIDAVKIGLLPTKELVVQAAKTLKKFGLSNIVIDPVLVAACGDSLADTDIIESYHRELFPIASIITPNRFEAEQLFGNNASGNTVSCSNASCSNASCNSKSRTLAATLNAGAKSILLKGGHSDNDEDVIDELYLQGEDTPIRYTAERVKTNNLHGTGCTLSSAIASFLAIHNGDIPVAVEKAKEYITKTIESGKNLKIGKGNGPVNHLFAPIPMLER